MPVKDISLNVDKSGSMASPTVAISQGDESSTEIRASILDGSAPYDLTGKSVRFKCTLPGGKACVDDSCSVVDAKAGVVSYTPPGALAAVAGKITSALFEIWSDGYRIHTTKLAIDVDSTPDGDGAAPGDYVPELDRLKAELARAADAANAASGSASAAASACKIAAEAANAATSKANAATLGANGAASAAKTAAANAGSAASEAKAAANAASASRDSADEAAADARKAAEEVRGAVSSDMRIYFKRVTDAQGNSWPVLVDMTV